jgi:hypothetical protein
MRRLTVVCLLITVLLLSACTSPQSARHSTTSTPKPVISLGSYQGTILWSQLSNGKSSFSGIVGGRTLEGVATRETYMSPCGAPGFTLSGNLDGEHFQIAVPNGCYGNVSFSGTLDGTRLRGVISAPKASQETVTAIFRGLVVTASFGLPSSYEAAQVTKAAVTIANG